MKALIDTLAVVMLTVLGSLLIILVIRIFYLLVMRGCFVESTS